MSAKIKVDSAELNRLLHGSLPATAKDVGKIESNLGLRKGLLVSAWEADAMELFRYLYPINYKEEDAPPEAKRMLTDLVEAVRRISLYAIGLKLFSPFFSESPKIYYPIWNELFGGKFDSLRAKQMSRDRFSELLLFMNGLCGASALDEARLLGLVDAFYDRLGGLSTEPEIETINLGMSDLSDEHALVEWLSPTPSDGDSFNKKAAAVVLGVLNLLPFRNSAAYAMVTFQKKTLQETGAALGVSGERARAITDKVSKRIEKVVKIVRNGYDPSVYLASLKHEALKGTVNTVREHIKGLARGDREALFEIVLSEAEAAIRESGAFPLEKALQRTESKIKSVLTGGQNSDEDERPYRMAGYERNNICLKLIEELKKADNGAGRMLENVPDFLRKKLGRTPDLRRDMVLAYTTKRLVRMAVERMYEGLRVGGSAAWPRQDTASDKPDDPYKFIIDSISEYVVDGLTLTRDQYWGRLTKALPTASH
jgi:hypothetical protein